MAVSESWTDEAKAMYADVSGALPDLDGPGLALLASAAEMLSQAAVWDAIVAEHGKMTKGSMGQLVVNPAATEARALRTASAATLVKLLPKQQHRIRTSEQARAAVRARWGSNPAAGTARADQTPAAPTADGGTVTPIRRPRRDV